MIQTLPWTLDAHCDTFEMKNFLDHDFNLSQSKHTVSQMTQNKLERIFKENVPTLEEYDYHVTFSRLEEGNVKALFLNVADYDLLESSEMTDGAYQLAQKFPNKVVICGNKKDIIDTVNQNKIALILVAEGPLVFQGQIDLLHNWHRLGIRIVNLSHGEGTEGFPKYAKLIYKHLLELAPTCALQISTSSECYLSALERNKLYKTEKGLTQIGKEMLKEMAKLNIICDLSHANDAAFWEALELSNGKFCVTHSNCAALCPHSRNLTDDMMQALAEHGGVMGLCFYGDFIDQQNPTLAKYVDHILHALEIMGPDHVGISSDYDGVPPDAFMAIPQPQHMNQLWQALAKAGADDETIHKIAHRNFLNLLQK